MNKEIIISERLKRQKLTEPLNDSRDTEAYKQLFRLLQPVAPIFNSRPGNPPQLVHRTTFDDSLLAENLREKHKLVKGRFQGGRIGYVLEDDLGLYASIFQKPIQKVSPLHEEVLSMIQHSGGMSKDQLKEHLPFKAREITAVLKRMQEAFLVYESQIDTDWNTGWFDFKTEWPGIELHQNTSSSVSEMLIRFLDVFVFATLSQIRNWSQLKLKMIQSALDLLIESGEIIKMEINGLGTGFMRKEDLNLSVGKIRPSIFMLDKSDFLVRANMSELKQIFKGREVLQYLLIDGDFKGAVLGHWRIGPYDIDDVELCLTQKESEERKEEVIAAIRKGYSKDTTAILQFNGEPLS
ncbi:hypothetical protein F3157_17395 [Virgibacillus dakarensis]|uniref:Uncharacterized protein n=1 Tax=Lentibacillus populi TaxID=1827502 RepID=A0A9W5TXK0_9BACI|nr:MULTISPECIES: hypothetical protein [Bacillaceae]MTW87410.1 hypothetical protein [Virgibacillus dakarensis]GGB38818.1 hypothetical protein GCM10011409_15390 [Lentibacillus populi]